MILHSLLPQKQLQSQVQFYLPKARACSQTLVRMILMTSIHVDPLLGVSGYNYAYKLIIVCTHFAVRVGMKSSGNQREILHSLIYSKTLSLHISLSNNLCILGQLLSVYMVDNCSSLACFHKFESENKYFAPLPCSQFFFCRCKFCICIAYILISNPSIRLWSGFRMT